MAIRPVSLVQVDQLVEGSIQNLSEEVIIEIFKHLPPPVLFEASQVCQKWSRLTQDSKLVTFVRATEDVKWLRNLPNISKMFEYLKPRFDAVQSPGNPVEERSALLRGLLKDETIETELNWRIRRIDFSTATFNLAARQGNIRMGQLLLPVDYVHSCSSFAICAENGQPDFVRWLVSLDPATSGLPPFNINLLTTIKIHAELKSEERLYLNGESLFERLDLRNPQEFDDGPKSWKVLLPLKRKEERSASGVIMQYWETVVLGREEYSYPGLVIPVIPIIHTADGGWIESKDIYDMPIGDTLEITPEFTPSNPAQ